MLHARVPSPRSVHGKPPERGPARRRSSRRRGGRGLCEELSQRGEAPYVILLGQSSDPRRIVRGIRAGAVGQVRKDESLDRLIQVIHGVAQGETWLPTGDTGEVLRRLLRRHDPGHSGGQRDARRADSARAGCPDLPCRRLTEQRDMAEHLHIFGQHRSDPSAKPHGQAGRALGA